VRDRIGRGVGVSDEIDRLWALRGLDEELVAHGTVLARFPAQRAELEGRTRAERAHVEQLKVRLADVQLKRRDLEREAGALAEQERRFQSQLPAIKKNEEYTALLHEIDGARRKRSDLETQVLMRMEEEEQVQRERPVADRALAAVLEENDERLRAIDAEEQAHRDAMAAIEGRRAAELEHLIPAVRNRYERIRTSREGRAVVPIVRSACGGCFRTQPPQVLQEARRRDRILSCEGCGRLLVWPPDGA
jgi:predicted  nucleic acid-binding Zn-ribbon protein